MLRGARHQRRRQQPEPPPHRPRGRIGLLRRPGRPPRRPAVQLDHETLLRFEVLVDRPLAHPRRLGDLDGRGDVISLSGEELEGGPNEALTGKTGHWHAVPNLMRRKEFRARFPLQNLPATFPPRWTSFRTL